TRETVKRLRPRPEPTDFIFTAWNTLRRLTRSAEHFKTSPSACSIVLSPKKDLRMKTYSALPGEVEQKWYLVDAADKTLGRIATEIAKILRGKNKPTFTPHIDTGDFVLVINSEKVKMSGNKWNDEKFYSHSRYFG